MSDDIFDCEEGAGYWLPVGSIEILPDILQCTGQTPQQRLSSPQISSDGVEKPCSGPTET